MRIHYWLGGGAFLVALAFGAFMMKPRVGNAGAEPAKPKQAQKIVVEPAPPPKENLQDSEGELNLTGSVVSDSKATLSTRLPARIVGVSISEGKAVSAGQVAIQLDDSEMQGQARTAFAGLNAAIAMARKAEEGLKAQLLKADSDIATARSGVKQAEIKRQQAILGRDALKGDNAADKRLADEAVRKAEIGHEQAVRTRKSLEELAKVGGVSRNDLQGAITSEKAAASDVNSAREQRKRLDSGATPQTSYRIALADKDIETAEAGVHQAQEGLKLSKEAKLRVRDVGVQDINTAKAATEQAKAGWRTAQDSTDSLRLRAPFAGVATAINAKVGEMAQPGMPLVTIISLTGLRVDALVTARHLARLKEGLPATVQVDSLPNRTFAAHLSQIAATSEPDGRTFRVQFRFVSPVTLSPGQVARVRLSPARL